MKSELQLIEECIEEKTKEYHQVVAQILATSGGIPMSSFGGVGVIQQKRHAEAIRAELSQMMARREQLLCDVVEIEVIRGNREEVSQCMPNLPEGQYRLVRIEGKDGK